MKKLLRKQEHKQTIEEDNKWLNNYNSALVSQLHKLSKPYRGDTACILSCVADMESSADCLCPGVTLPNNYSASSTQ